MASQSRRRRFNMEVLPGETDIPASADGTYQLRDRAGFTQEQREIFDSQWLEVPRENALKVDTTPPRNVEPELTHTQRPFAYTPDMSHHLKMVFASTMVCICELASADDKDDIIESLPGASNYHYGQPEGGVRMLLIEFPNYFVLAQGGTNSIRQVQEYALIYNLTLPMDYQDEAARGYFQGFRNWARICGDWAIEQLDFYTRTRPRKPVILCGFSLGSGCLAYTAERLHLAGYQVGEVFGLGSPRSITQERADDWNQKFRALNFCNWRDPVSWIPVNSDEYSVGMWLALGAVNVINRFIGSSVFCPGQTIRFDTGNLVRWDISEAQEGFEFTPLTLARCISDYHYVRNYLLYGAQMANLRRAEHRSWWVIPASITALNVLRETWSV